MPAIRIPFNRPSVVGRELEYMAEAARLGHLSGDGSFTRRCNAWLEEYLAGSKVLLTTSCTHALEMCALLLDIRPGDEVILPDFTFVSTVNAFVLRGATPVFADIRADTLNLDETCLERLITPRTRAIIVMHYAGISCEMDVINSLTQQYGLAVVEDNAHGLFGSYRGRRLGTLGSLATQSFHDTKNVTCGEGGALVIIDTQYIERAEILREKGTNRSRFFRGQVDKYTWVDIGSSYLPSDMLAAFLLAQLEASSEIQSTRQRIWNNYAQYLAPWASANGVRLPNVPAHCDQSYHMFYVILSSYEQRQGLIEYLRDVGIGSAFHYLPLHLSDMGRRYGGRPGDYPVAEDISDRLLRLPFYNTLSESDQSEVIDAIRGFDLRGS